MSRIAAFALSLLSLGLWMSPAAVGQCLTWSPPANVSRDAGHYAVDGNLAVDSTGQVHLVYQSFLDSYGEAFYVTNLSLSSDWSLPQSLGSQGGKGSAPKIVITPDNTLHAFYGKSNIYWRTKPVGSGAWSSPVQIDANPAGGSFIQQVTVDGTGGVYFMYGHLFDSSAPARNGIYGRYKPLGGAWSATELIYGNSDDGNWPRGDDIAARGDTLWAAIGVDGDAYFKNKPSTGAWPAGKGTKLLSDAGGLRFAFNPVSSEICALYTKSLPCSDPCEDDPWFEVFAKYSYDDGATWTAPDNISDNVDDIDRSPSAVYDSAGNLHVVWEGFCCDHTLRMRYRGRINGVWDPAITVVTSHVGGHVPNSIKSFGDNLFLTFSDSSTGIGMYDVVFSTAAAIEPKLGLSPSSLTHTILVGSEVDDDLLSVTNVCVGVLDYTVSVSDSWLEVSPTAGSVTTETDTIIVSYPQAQTMTAGTHNATITIAGNAVNTPQTVAVQLKIQSVKPDFDGDGDVDQADFGHLQECMSGFAVPQIDPDCSDTLLNPDDEFVDGTDLGIFLGCLSGSGVRADMTCAALYP
ncbi:MAG: BACON domain-containing protein [Planctomycetes bacterium]|nr:BACON domain-containing protein [Planctomycetota bacterium]